jgi:hypothetical protein
MREPIEQVIAKILSFPAPVVMPDTASLLNIIEASTQEERVSPNIIPAAVSFLDRLQATPSTLHIVLSHVVEEEWARHHESKEKKAIASIRSEDARIAFLYSIASSMTSAPPEPYVQFSGLQIAQRLHSVAEQLIGHARIIGNNQEFVSAVGDRFVHDKAPASSTRKEVNDCLLIEQYLALCRRLCAAGFTQRCIFVTSNTRDFGQPKAPCQPLDREFRESDIDFVYDFAAAHALLTTGIANQ